MSDMSSQELFSVLRDYCNDNGKEVVECVTDLLSELRADTNMFCNKLEGHLEEFAVDNNICVGCGEDLVFKPDHTVPMYQGCPVGINICPNGCDC